jgi:hypothetical protein
MLRVIHDHNQNIPGLWRDKINIHVDIILNPTCFTPFFKALPNLHHLLTPLLFSSTPFGWPRSIMLTPTYSITSLGIMIFYLRLFDLRPLFHENQPGGKVKQLL